MSIRVCDTDDQLVARPRAKLFMSAECDIISDEAQIGSHFPERISSSFSIQLQSLTIVVRGGEYRCPRHQDVGAPNRG